MLPLLSGKGLEPWLLASRVLYSVKSLDEFLYLQKKVRNESYKGALKCLRVALDSTPPAPEALFPLVQVVKHLLVIFQISQSTHSSILVVFSTNEKTYR